MRIRSRATGWVAGCSKGGGLICRGLGALALVPPIGTAAHGLAIPVGHGLGLMIVYGRETRGRDLRALERSVAIAFKTDN